MKKIDSNDTAALRALALAYFDGTATEDQEARLRARLRYTPATGDPDVEAARAVMGFVCREQLRRSARRRPTAARPHGRFPAFLAGAAAAAALAVVALPGLLQGQADGDCRAFVGGRQVDDHALVMNLVQDDWQEISDAQQDVQESVDSQLATMLSTIDDPQ